MNAPLWHVRQSYYEWGVGVGLFCAQGAHNHLERGPGGGQTLVGGPEGNFHGFRKVR